MIELYHYISKEKYERIKQESFLRPSAPFNSKITNKKWEEYTQRFEFPITQYYICTFLEQEPQQWKEYGLFGLLMKEFSGGDLILKLKVEDNNKFPILVRDHMHHSPKEYGLLPEVWKRREMRDSRPDLREKWYNSTVQLKDYNENYVCPEILIPFAVRFENISIM